MTKQAALRFIIWKQPGLDKYRIKFASIKPSLLSHTTVCAYIYLLFDSNSDYLKKSAPPGRCINEKYWSSVCHEAKASFYYETPAGKHCGHMSMTYQTFLKKWLGNVKYELKDNICEFLRQKKIKIVHLREGKRKPINVTVKWNPEYHCYVEQHDPEIGARTVGILVDKIEETKLASQETKSKYTIIYSTGLNEASQINNTDMKVIFKEILPANVLKQSDVQSATSDTTVYMNSPQSALRLTPQSVLPLTPQYATQLKPASNILPLVPLYIPPANMPPIEPYFGSELDYQDRKKKGLIGNATYEEFRAALDLLRLF
jgi:hypothetical protein